MGCKRLYPIDLGQNPEATSPARGREERLPVVSMVPRRTDANAGSIRSRLDSRLTLGWEDA